MTKTTPPKVYVASTLSNWKQARQAINILNAANIDITYDWTIWGENIYGDGAEVKKGSIKTPEELRKIGEDEVKGVYEAGVILALMPGERGSHFEMAIAWMLYKPVIICTDTDTAARPTSFHYLPRFERFESQAKAIDRTVRLVRAIGELGEYGPQSLISGGYDCES